MRCGKAILQAMRSAGVLGHVASNRAYSLRRRIGGIKISMRRNPLRNVVVDHSGFHRNALVRNIHIESPGHAGKADDDSRSIGHRTARESSACTPANKWDLMLRADLN